MGDLKNGESFVDCVFIADATGAAKTGLSPVCSLVKVADGTTTTPSVTEVGGGLYKATITPNADGTWFTLWSTSAIYTIYVPYKEFKVGGGVIADNATAITALENKVKASPTVDSILFKASGATCPTGKSIWNALGDGTKTINDLDTGIAAIPTAPALASALTTLATYIYNGSGGAMATNTSVYSMESAIKAKTDLISAAPISETNSFNWAHTANSTNEIDISALFATPLNLTTLRQYTVYLDLINIQGDAGAYTTCTLRLKTKIDASTYRVIDTLVTNKTLLGVKPGVVVTVPPVAQNIQLTMQFDVSLAGDQTVYYHYVKQPLQ